MGHRSMTKKYGLSALVSPRVATGVGLILLTSLLGGTGCGLSYSLTGIYVEPTSACLYPGSTAQFTAYGTYTEGGHAVKVQDVSSQVTWATSLSDVATVNTSGMATAGSAFVGNTPLTATAHGEFGILTSSANVVVSTSCSTSSSYRPAALHLIPASQNLTVGQTLEPVAVATDENGRVMGLSGRTSWSSSDSKVAAVDGHGVITAVGAGDATITATGKTANGEVVSATQTVHLTANN